MKKCRTTSSSDSSPKPRRPALSTEAREGQLISYAIDLAEKQLLEGTASSQVITHYLKQSTEKTKLEILKLEHENELLRAKTAAIQSQQRSEEMIERAMRAFKNYSGNGYPQDYDY
jgi:hypothetical protein